MIFAKWSGQNIITVAPPGEGKNYKESLSCLKFNSGNSGGWMEKKTNERA